MLPMSKCNPIHPRHSERGESNTKFIVSLSLFILMAYSLYAFLPVYFKEQQLKHDIREKTRVGAVNGYDVKRLETDCKKIIDDIDFPNKFDVKIVKKGDNLSIACSGAVPIKFVVYTYQYKIDFEEKFSRGGY